MKIKAGVFERIEQSFVLFKDNFLSFFTMIFLYKALFVLLIGISFFIFSDTGKDFITGIYSSEKEYEGIEFFYQIEIIIALLVGIFVFILFLLFYIPFILGLIKSLKQAENGEKPNAIENLKYGFSRLGQSFKTYWFIFAYIALVPALIFIFGGILFNIGFFYGDNDLLQTLGVIFMSIGGVLFFISAIYRGIKTSFSISSAVDQDSFTKENFNYSLNITENNWWRILGNFMLVGILVSIVFGIINMIKSLILFFVNMTDGSFSFDNLGSYNIEMLNDMFSNYGIVKNTFFALIDVFFQSIEIVFMIVFTYLFYLRLEREKEYLKDMKTENEEL